MESGLFRLITYMYSDTFNSSSRCFIWTLTVGCDINSSLAATEKLLQFATQRKVLTYSNLINSLSVSYTHQLTTQGTYYKRIINFATDHLYVLTINNHHSAVIKINEPFILMYARLYAHLLRTASTDLSIPQLMHPTHRPSRRQAAVPF